MTSTERREGGYWRGKVYKLVPKGIVDYVPYIGSTKQKHLSSRLVGHKSQYKKYKSGKGNYVSSFELFDKYGIDNCEIILIEEYPCHARELLTARERHFIETINCCNRTK
jgi:hypothetical protein